MKIQIFLTTLLCFLCINLAVAETGDEVVLLFAGDAMQHQKQLDVALQNGRNKTYDYSECFKFIAHEISAADYAVCNLEVPLGGGPSYSGFPNFSAPDSYALALRDAGFDMMLTSNNHCLDRGDKAARRTLEALDRMGIDHVGTFHDETDRTSKVPFIKDINGIKFGFLDYTYGTNGIDPTSGMEVALIDKERMADEISKTRESGAEILVVAMHWGTEYVLRESSVQRDLADFLVDQGVDLVIGGHPHVIQPMEVRRNDKENKDVLVVYSLGNLISNMTTADTSGGALVRVKVQRDEDGVARFKHADYDTFYTAKPEGAFKNFTVIPSWMSEKIPAGQKDAWNIFNRSSSKIFDKYNKNVARRHN